MEIDKDFLKEQKINLKRANTMLTEYARDNQGNIILKEGSFIISKLPVVNYSFTNGWILLIQKGVLNRQGVQGRMALVKSYISDECPRVYKGIDAEMTMANNFILPELAKQFQLDAAEYYNVVFEECEELNCIENCKKNGRIPKRKIESNHRYLLSPTFLENNEELIHLADIFKDKRELRITQMLQEIEEYLRLRHIPGTDIKAIKGDFIKQCIFNKYIDFSDEHNLNAGIIVKKDGEQIRARLAPCYDLDFASGIYNKTNGEICVYYFRKSDDGKDTLDSILNQFRGNFEMEYLKEIIPQINLNLAIKNGEKYGGFKLSDEARRKYEKFFKMQQSDLVNFYNRAYGQIQQNNDEER